MKYLVPDEELHALLQLARRSLSAKHKMPPGAAVAMQSLVSVAIAERCASWVPPAKPDTSGVM